jgi:hypothetical protein
MRITRSCSRLAELMPLSSTQARIRKWDSVVPEAHTFLD